MVNEKIEELERDLVNCRDFDDIKLIMEKVLFEIKKINNDIEYNKVHRRWY